MPDTFTTFPLPDLVKPASKGKSGRIVEIDSILHQLKSEDEIANRTRSRMDDDNFQWHAKIYKKRTPSASEGVLLLYLSLTAKRIAYRKARRRNIIANPSAPSINAPAFGSGMVGISHQWSEHHQFTFHTLYNYHSILFKLLRQFRHSLERNI
jgi:hypothetical protein